QGVVSNVVWTAGVRLLFPPIDQQKRRAELGCAGLPRFRFARNLFLVGTSRKELGLATLREHSLAGRANHERDRIGHRLAPHRWLSVAAKRSERPDARLEKRDQSGRRNARRSRIAIGGETVSHRRRTRPRVGNFFLPPR